MDDEVLTGLCHLRFWREGDDEVSEVAEELIEALIQFKDKPAPQK